ncbi:MAG: hypothetical protein GF349_02415 [Candidatus Magasanikbacteria bacterium]|nr:hypothetical protein [Candidatus Magasanikbacteria bacterium]
METNLAEAIEEIAVNDVALAPTKLARFWQALGFPQDLFKDEQAMNLIAREAIRRRRLFSNSNVDEEIIATLVGEYCCLSKDEVKFIAHFNKWHESRQKQMLECFRLLAKDIKRVSEDEIYLIKAEERLESSRHGLRCSLQHVQGIMDNLSDFEMNKARLWLLYKKFKELETRLGRRLLPQSKLFLFWKLFNVSEIDKEDREEDDKRKKRRQKAQPKAGWIKKARSVMTTDVRGLLDRKQQIVGRPPLRGVLKVKDLARIGKELFVRVMQDELEEIEREEEKKKLTKAEALKKKIGVQKRAETILVGMDEWTVIRFFLKADEKEVIEFNAYDEALKERGYERYSGIFRLDVENLRKIDLSSLDS